MGTGDGACERREATRTCGVTGRRRPRLPAPIALPLVILLLLASGGCGPAHRASPGQAAGLGGQGAAPAATPPPQLVYVALGASDAFGIGTDDPATQAWPVVLARSLGDSYRLVNLGIPGATVALATRDELPLALDAQPAIVTVWLAVNDFDAGVTLDTYTDQLHALLRQLASGSRARIYVGNLPDLALLPYFAHDDPALLESEVAAWNAAIAAVCSESGAMLVDLYGTELTAHPEYISSDGFHPSAAGAARLAALFAAAIGPTGSPSGSPSGSSGSSGATGPTVATPAARTAAGGAP